MGTLELFLPEVAFPSTSSVRWWEFRPHMHMQSPLNAHIAAKASGNVLYLGNKIPCLCVTAYSCQPTDNYFITAMKITMHNVLEFTNNLLQVSIGKKWLCGTKCDEEKPRKLQHLAIIGHSSVADERYSN